jgi:hypothetical protein
MMLDQNHALYVGAVWGLAMKHGLPLLPEQDDDGNYTDRLVMDISDKITVTFIVPPPPEGWDLGAWLGDEEARTQAALNHLVNGGT